MINKVMLTMESRIHGDMYVRFGGRLVETYYRKVEKRCWPS
ncbi:recombinase, partial [Parabacteroides merdae]